jgi:hypothetical protein
MAAKRRVHPLIKVAIAIVLLAGVGLLFVRSVKDTRAEPYVVSASHLQNWTLGIDTAADADGAVVSLRPQPELPMNLFRQLFSRQMESLGTPSQPGIALVLRREIPPELTADSVLAMARDAGLEGVTPAPKCVGYRRVSDPGITRQLYFMWLDVPGFDRFRQALASRVGPGFTAGGLSPVLMMAAEPGFTGWMPVVVDQNRDCIAPVTINK